MPERKWGCYGHIVVTIEFLRATYELEKSNIH